MSETGDKPEGERIAKVIARAGVASRRDAERLIAEGRVSVDGDILDSPALVVGPGADIRIDGERLPAAEPTRLFRFHKDRGLVTAARDPQERPTIYSKLPAGLPRVMPIGRLDLTTEGLLLLTNDGGLKRMLELPSTGWLRRYRVRAYGKIDQASLDALAGGVTIDGVAYGPIKVEVQRSEKANSWLVVSLREGKNREVRHALEHAGLQVNRLIRTAYGPFQLGGLKPNELAEVPAKVLREQLGSLYPIARR
ncbi:MAG: pseudouridine synthase [Geminicoccaceae bacterium]